MRAHPFFECSLSFVLFAVLLPFNDIKGQDSDFDDPATKKSMTRSEWSLSGDPLGSKAFVENLGQFTYEGLPQGTEVLYGAEIGDRVLFTEQGLFYRVGSQPEMSWKEAEEKFEEGETPKSSGPHFVRMTWAGASKDARLIAEAPKEGSYTYGDLPGERASGYDRLVYKDLYPGVDVIYEMPDEKGGLKYRIEAEPGADLNKVRMKYHLPGDSLELTPEGHLKVGTRHGAITDHAPDHSTLDDEEVDARFELEDRTVRFVLDQEMKEDAELLIDPWTTTPSTLDIPGTGTLIYDVDEDEQGNVYVSGGDGPFKTAKISSAGNLLWTFTWPPGWSSYSGSWYYYTELTVIPQSGSIFIGTGFNPGTAGVKVMKVGSNGSNVDSSSLFTGNNEIWKMLYNRCSGQLYGFGGGTSGSNNDMQIISDTNIATATATVNNFNNSSATCCSDIADVVMDTNGDFYAILSTLDPTNPNHDEKIEKGLEPNYNSLGFSVNSGYKLEEGSPNSQIPIIGSFANDAGTVRQNTLALNSDHLYSYDGRTLKAWDKSTGALLGSEVVDPAYQGDTSNTHEGIDVDECNNVYVGGNAEVHIYHFDGTNFNPNGSITSNISGEVYDVKLEYTPTRLIVGGNGFVSAVSPLSCSDTLNPHLSVTQPSCDSGSNGTISVDSVSGAVGPYSYQWSTGDTTSSVSGLGGGSYDLTVMKQSCANSLSWDTTITLDQSGDLSIDSLVVQEPTCDSPCSGSIDVEYSGATPPLQFSIDSGNSYQTDSLFTSLCAGTYDVLVEDSACTVHEEVELKNDQQFDHDITSNSISCNGACDGSIDISVSGGGAPFQFSIDSGTTFQPGSTFTALCPDTFDVLIQDSAGCTAYSNEVLTQPEPLDLSVDSIAHVSCEASSDGYISLTGSGGSTPYDLQWGPNAGNQTGPVLNGLAPGNYQCVLTDSSGCQDSLSVTIDGHPALTLSSSSDTTICDSGNVTLSASGSGGNPPYTYLWNGTASGPDTTVSPTSTTLYTVEVLDSSGCRVGPDSILVTVLPPLSLSVDPVTSICEGNSAVLTANASGGNGSYNFSWSNGDDGASTTVSPSTTTSYSVNVTSGCPGSNASDSVTVPVEPLPQPRLSADTLSGCVPLEVELTNETDPAQTGDCIWYIENGDTLSGCNDPKTVIEKPGCHDITLSVTSPDGCTQDTTYEDQICTYPLPEADFSFEPDTANVLDPTVNFLNASKRAVQYRWDFGGLDSSSATDPSYTFPEDERGSYPVCLEAISTYGCRDTSCEKVIVEGEFLLYVPNAFTPDGDGINDAFYPVVQGHDPSDYQFQIYDRWGELIFQSEDPEEKWRGRVKGSSTLAKPDVYVWKLKLRSEISGEHETFTGHVTLVR